MSLYQLERERNLEELVETLKRSENPQIRQRAAQIIGGLFESDDFEESDLALGDGSTDQLGFDASNGDDSDRETVVDVLVTIVGEDESEAVRAAAIDALDHHGQEAIERIVAELSGKDLQSASDWVAARAFADVLDAERPELRMAAATGLGRVGDPSATEALIQRLSDPKVRVRSRSAMACGRIGDPRAVEPLEKLLTRDPNVAVRKSVAEALGEIKTAGSLDALLDAIDDPSEPVRRVIADALGAYDSIRPVDPLVEYLDDESEVVRRTAMFSLVEVLSNAPPQRSHEVREAAADKLEDAAPTEVVPPLAEILTESSGAPQRRNAAWLLGQVVGAEYRETARDALLGALGDDDGLTAQFAATSLTRLDDPDLEAELLAVARNEDASDDARSKALFVLGKVGGESARNELDEFVERTDSDALREQAFSALSKLGGVGGGETL